MQTSHPWYVSIEEARRIQEDLKRHLVIYDPGKMPETVGGSDVAYRSDGKRACCVIAVLTYPGLDYLCHSVYESSVSFPYLPGLLAFREGPLVEGAFSGLERIPDVLIFDGHGICHPSGMGIASHMGIVLDLPTIGCAKSRLAGTCTRPGPFRGDASPILMSGIRVGYVLRTRDHVRPVFVSPGHMMGVDSSAQVCLKCAAGFRIPEPVRYAHHLSREHLAAISA